jgi:TM2 domain-containing membrane protein YozV
MREKLVAILLAFFLGVFGIHHFYLGQKKLGIAYLLFCWTMIPIFLGIVDAVLLFLKKQNDFNLKYNSEYYLDRSERMYLEEDFNSKIKIPDNRRVHYYSTADEMDKLHELMLKGIISEQEFAERKNRL